MSTRPIRPMRRRPRRRAPAVLAVTLAAGILAGCAAGGATAPESTDGPPDEDATADGTDPSEESSTELSQQEQVLAFYQCLRDEGLDVADPDLGAGGPTAGVGGPAGLDMDDPAVAAAVDLCGDEVGQVTFGDGQMGEGMAEPGALIDYVDCLRDHGIEMADPGPDGRLSMPTNFDPQDPAFQAATQECGPLLGGGGVLIGGGDGGSGRSGG